jgi:diguanylate cyclase (GGDEF)-like protein
MSIIQKNCGKLLPKNEELRLAAIKYFDILDTPADGAFDRLTQLAGRVFGVPIAIITIVDTDRIWFKSKLGLDVSEIGRDPGLCASCIMQEDVMVIRDAKQDAVALTNPLVAGEFGLRFYAGAPLKTREGLNIGTFCLVDREPREFNTSQQATLADLAAIVIDEMELRTASRRLVVKNMETVEEAEKTARTDLMTGLGNRRAFEADIAEFEHMITQGVFSDILVTVIDLDGLKQVNDRHGHAEGDYLIQTFSSGIKESLRINDRAYRIGGDEFVVLSPLSAKPDFAKIKDRIAKVVEDVRKETGYGEAGASVGIAVLSAAEFSMQQALRLADKRMYDDKKKRVKPNVATAES